MTREHKQLVKTRQFAPYQSPRKMFAAGELIANHDFPSLGVMEEKQVKTRSQQLIF